jgi:hypothetical protein
VSNALPKTILDTKHLDDLLSTPTPGVVECFARLDGNLLILGAGGKMGPSLARMAKRAAPQKRVVAVSRFSTPGSQEQFERHDIETIAADLLDTAQLAALPEAQNIVYMAGMKFGATGNEPLTWAMNTFLPGMVCQRFPKSRIVAFSTGNVYPLTPLRLGGSVETDQPAPLGEYAMSCLGRERIFEHFSRTQGNPIALLRLNYAVELRYGVPVDIAKKVWNGEPIPLAMGTANVLWQGDANAMALQSFDLTTSPATILNLAGPEQLSVRRMAQFFGERMGKTPILVGEEAPTALLSNGQRLLAHTGNPHVPVQSLLSWIADWVMRGGESLGKPTHFEARDGKF